MSLMPFTEPEHVELLLEGTKKQTTRLPRKHPVKIGETLYCYYKPRMKASCNNCIAYNNEDTDCVHGNKCHYWHNYFGEAKAILTEHYWNPLSFPEVINDGSDHRFAQFAELVKEPEGKAMLEEWATKDGFLSFKQADKWFIEHHGMGWMNKDLDVITFEPKWLARRVA